jgi:hypothetical protein
MENVNLSPYYDETEDYLGSYQPDELLLDYMHSQRGPFSQEVLLDFINSYEYKKTLLELERLHSKMRAISQAAMDDLDAGVQELLDEEARQQAEK